MYFNYVHATSVVLYTFTAHNNTIYFICSLTLKVAVAGICFLRILVECQIEI